MDFQAKYYARPTDGRDETTNAISFGLLCNAANIAAYVHEVYYIIRLCRTSYKYRTSVSLFSSTLPETVMKKRIESLR